MPKRPDAARVRAAVAAGDPPASAQYMYDENWHSAQSEWLAKWSVRLLPEGPQRRRQWVDRVKEHARLVATAAKAAFIQAPAKRKRARKPMPPAEREPVLAGPPRAKRVLPPSQPAYELAMGRYAMARDERRKQPRRTQTQNAKRMRDYRELTAMMASSNLDGSAAARSRMEKESERSKRRREANKATACHFYEARFQQRQRDEQVALVRSIDDALAGTDSLRMEFESARYWDEPLCRAIQGWAALHTPDGSQAWEDALMAVAIPAATLRVSGPSPADAYRRVGALNTLRGLVRNLSFQPKPGSLHPDPSMSVADRASEGYCV